MRAVRGRDDARLLPARYAFALSRLAAWIRLRRSKPRPGTTLWMLDRHQSAGETYAVALWVTATGACFIAGTMLFRLRPAAAFAIAVPLSVIALQIVIIVGALLIRPIVGLFVHLKAESTIRVNSIFVMSVLTAAALHLAWAESWVRIAAWQFLAVLAVNAVAALILIPLRKRIEAAEAAIGGEASEG